MPRRRAVARQQKITPAMIERMRESVRAGYPWLHLRWGKHFFGYFDLLTLVKGRCYQSFCDLLTGDNEKETARYLWNALGADILTEHVKRRPGSRPRAWWDFADRPREPFQVVGVSRERCAATYNGTPIVTALPEDQVEPILETEFDYLERLGLLTDGERKIFDKYGDIDYVRRTAGTFGECAECWREARAKASAIDFDLDGAVLPHDVFWVPDELIFPCAHQYNCFESGIFTIDRD